MTLHEHNGRPASEIGAGHSGMSDAGRRPGTGGPHRTDAIPAVRHVIAESRHRVRTVTCECGWHGSSATVNGQPSEWTRHVAEHRPEGR